MDIAQKLLKGALLHKGFLKIQLKKGHAFPEIEKSSIQCLVAKLAKIRGCIRGMIVNREMKCVTYKFIDHHG